MGLIDVGRVTPNLSSRVPKAERRNRVIELRRQGLSREKIAELIGWSHETVRRDENYYLAKLDQENLAAAAALRAEQYQRLEEYAGFLHEDIAQNKDLGRIADAVKVSEQQRRIYALDVVPTKKTEITHRKAIVTELIVNLRASISPAAYAEVVTALSVNDSYQLMGITSSGGGEEGIDPPAALLAGQRDQESANEG